MIIFDAMLPDRSNVFFKHLLFLILILKFIFRLLNGRIKARRKQLNQIASLLEMTSCETNYTPNNSIQKQS